MNAAELVRLASEAKPHIHYRAHTNGTAVGAWNDRLERWVTVAGLLITGKWASMPVEILIDGKLAVDPAGYGPPPQQR